MNQIRNGTILNKWRTNEQPFIHDNVPGEPVLSQKRDLQEQTTKINEEMLYKCKKQ